VIAIPTAGITVTCRVCEADAEAQADGVLLCAFCRQSPQQTRAEVNNALDAACDAHVSALMVEDAELIRRWQLAIQAGADARTEGGAAVLRWQRRIDRTIAEGGPLGHIAQTFRVSRQTRAWAASALQELDALEGNDANATR
jgi:hypothetical protein